MPKAQRTGCYVYDLSAIVAYKDAWYAALRRDGNGILRLGLSATQRKGKRKATTVT